MIKPSKKLLDLIISKYHSMDIFNKILKIHLLSSSNKCVFLIYNGYSIDIINKDDLSIDKYIPLLEINNIKNIDYSLANKIIHYY